MEPVLTIDGREAECRDGETLIEVCDRMGIRVPRLCHHPSVSPYGACRLCLVEQRRADRTRVVASCEVPAAAGGEFLTDTPRVRRLRRLVMELHLARCPDSPALRALAGELGVRQARLRPLAESCILCGLCERVCREVVGAAAVGFSGRGTARRLTAAFGEVPDDCIGCGLCTFVCPTDAIHMREAAVERLRRLPGDRRPCRHALTGLYPAALCSHAYECESCEVDQRLRELAGTHPALTLARRGSASALSDRLASTRRTGGMER
jgi:NAD-dependent dihydropyrimidine dehydrogenase PreA subunit